MRAVVLTVADPEVGLGHLSRCEALAHALTGLSSGPVDVLVATRSGRQWLGQRSGFERSRSSEWLASSQLTREAVRNAEVTVLDAYSVPAPVWQTVEEMSRHLVVFDDHASALPQRGVVVNTSPGALQLPYPDRPELRLLLGPRYQPLRPAFWTRSARAVRADVSNVLVAMGGTDATGQLERIVRALRPCLPQKAIVKALGNRGVPELGVEATGFLQAVELRRQLDACDLIVTAAGQTLSEAVSRQLPAVIFQTADNQAANAMGWDRSGVGAFAGTTGDPDLDQQLQATLTEVLRFDVRRSMAESAESFDLASSTQRLACAILAEVTG